MLETRAHGAIDSRFADLKRFVVPSSGLLVALGVLCAAPTAALAAEGPGKGRQITACTSMSIEGLFREMVPLKGLEQLGYKIDMPRTLTVPAEHQATASGDCTYTFDHWVPMHDPFFDPIKDLTIRIGPTVAGAGQGYLIDKKTADAHGITSLEQFKDPAIAKLFDSNGNGKADLCCTNPGWGAERVTNHLLDTIGLRDTVDHNQGEYTAMMADTIARFRRGEPVLFYTWTPHWLLGELQPGRETVWLDVDPKFCEKDASCGESMTGFPLNDIYIVANGDFMTENPTAKAFLEQVQISIGDLNTQNLLMRQGEDKEADIMRHVDQWIAKNQAMFDSWVENARKAQ
jgi:glycine betaine/proline transport system substrate-binding protein